MALSKVTADILDSVVLIISVETLLHLIVLDFFSVAFSRDSIYMYPEQI